MTCAENAWLLVPALLFCSVTVEVIAHGEQTTETLPASRMSGVDPNRVV